MNVLFTLKQRNNLMTASKITESDKILECQKQYYENLFNKPKKTEYTCKQNGSEQYAWNNHAR
jgi:hypothetical protein